MEGLMLLRLRGPFLAGTPPARSKSFRRIHGFQVHSSMQSQSIEAEKHEYKPGLLDDLLLGFFRRKMVEVRVLISLFPPFLLPLFKMLITPIQDGKIASMMLARATAISCQWLMGTCSVNSVDLPDGSSCSSGVFVERCKYLEESKCLGVCINTCKLPTQTFFKDCMGVPLLMEPNFADYSCQFKFGVTPPAQDTDKALQEPCLDICPNVRRRRNLRGNNDVTQCPKV
ncbi:beta-carotene isomerase D27, chloroplastic isoform X3 [Dioscorea cayenensis subsp. rotundata]|uniref:Beta-carotene isomerase D27, chloroplastic isoform X3 n=1 Tax=Dioscorea cayennensis subsp. rotundata TaxID=55577 RepID=A0AB40BNN8_DIOCR|nr:beta-carotene isomerase D27, chloroplastic isoform X3 [Dioscorea cayenensis subsp. rotundata]